MAAVLRINGCKDIESLLEICDVSKQNIHVDDSHNNISLKVGVLEIIKKEGIHSIDSALIISLLVFLFTHTLILYFHLTNVFHSVICIVD